MVGQTNDTKRSRDADGELKLLERMADATQSMSDFGMVEQKVRGGDMNWAVSYQYPGCLREFSDAILIIALF